MREPADSTEHPEEVALLDYVTGELEPGTSDAIRRHVDGCADCRDRIVGLAMDMDAIDRLPTIAIPHDVVRGALGARFVPPRSRLVRALPLAVLGVVLLGVVALFEVGGLRGDLAAPSQRQVVVHIAKDADARGSVDSLLATIPHLVTVDRDDPRHLVVLVSDADLAVAEAQLGSTSPADGVSYIVDVGGVGQLDGRQP